MLNPENNIIGEGFKRDSDPKNTLHIGKFHIHRCEFNSSEDFGEWLIHNWSQIFPFNLEKEIVLPKANQSGILNQTVFIDIMYIIDTVYQKRNSVHLNTNIIAKQIRRIFEPDFKG